MLFPETPLQQFKSKRKSLMLLHLNFKTSLRRSYDFCPSFSQYKFIDLYVLNHHYILRRIPLDDVNILFNVLLDLTC